jgi:hypothetical protein
MSISYEYEIERRTLPVMGQRTEYLSVFLLCPPNLPILAPRCFQEHARSSPCPAVAVENFQQKPIKIHFLYYCTLNYFQSIIITLGHFVGLLAQNPATSS